MNARPERMHYGTVAMIDVLGWKGIWRQNEDYAAPLDALRRIKDGATPLLEQFKHDNLYWKKAVHPGTPEDVTCDIRFLSDTVVIAAGVTLQSGHFLGPITGATNRAVAAVASKVIQLGATGNPPLLFRGAIATGSYLVDDTFVIGPAIDRAATWMNAPDGPFVIADPGSNEHDGTAEYFRCHVPMKDGHSIECMTINPFHGLETREQIEVEKGFNNANPMPIQRPELVRKRQHMEAMLKAVKIHMNGPPTC